MLGPSKPEPAVYLAAFGKHPGWNDHIDDLGLDTDDLVTAKRLLYMQGINQNIDAGAWENLDPDKRLPDFRHEFLWHMNGNGSGHSLIAGRFWSSVDGKGRDKYPMVLCAATVELPDNFAASTALRALAKTHERCTAATTADQIRQIIQSDGDALRATLQPPPQPDMLQGKQIAAVANSRDLAPSREGFHRIVYQIARGMSAYRPNAPANGNKRPEQIRVPLCGMKPADALLFWLRFSLTLLAPTVPILLLAPDPEITRTVPLPPAPEPDDTPPEERSVSTWPPHPARPALGWIDILVGEPTSQNLFCIKANLKSLPLTSEIPYTLDPSFCSASTTSSTPAPPSPPTTPPPGPLSDTPSTRSRAKTGATYKKREARKTTMSQGASRCSVVEHLGAPWSIAAEARIPVRRIRVGSLIAGCMERPQAALPRHQSLLPLQLPMLKIVAAGTYRGLSTTAGGPCRFWSVAHGPGSIHAWELFPVARRVQWHP